MRAAVDRLLEPDFVGAEDVWLLTNDDVRRTSRVRAVIDFLKQTLRKDLKTSMNIEPKAVLA